MNLSPGASAPTFPGHVPVLIAGGGPVGLTLAALLARQGVASLVIEADSGYCTGSRAICISRRSLEILGWVGADVPLVAKGLAWTGGRSYWRELEVLHFEMPSEAGERYAPMVNIQQYYIEEYAHRASQAQRAAVDVRWSTRVVAVRESAGGASGGVEVDLEDAAGKRHTVHTDWLVACDGGRSTVREQLGLQLEGMQYEGRYVIVDIEQKSERAVERLAWFDPPSNPGSTILMHRQPDDVWRIDYQIRDDEDPVEAVKPENVLPRVRSHLQMIGETAPWTPLWISIYNAKCLSLRGYRHGRVLLAGDAAHLVPIFGVRGLNSGLDDAANLAWKLALVVQGKARDTLLDSYSSERVHAAQQNIAYGAKSTEFMAPPHAGFVLMREAALRLAGADERVRSLVNPRQSAPISYGASPLNLTAREQGGAAQPGDPAPDARLESGALSEHFGDTFVALYFHDHLPLPAALAALATPGLRLWRVTRQGGGGASTLADPQGQARERYAAADGTLVLVRPDAYVVARWHEPDAATVATALATFGLLTPGADS